MRDNKPDVDKNSLKKITVYNPNIYIYTHTKYVKFVPIFIIFTAGNLHHIKDNPAGYHQNDIKLVPYVYYYSIERLCVPSVVCDPCWTCYRVNCVSLYVVFFSNKFFTIHRLLKSTNKVHSVCSLHFKQSQSEPR